MLRISALNDSSASEDDSQKIHQTQTKEAKEAEAFAAYNKALSHQQKGNTLHAEKLLRNLIDHPLLKEASSLVDDENQAQSLNHPGLQLLYSIQKNLAFILLQREQLHEAMAAYIEAVKIDSSEVTVWFKMGQVAKELHNYPLAKICFQQALRCNPNHWPSLDNAITITFALGDYLTCLENISTALEKDYSYPKGLVLRKQILTEQPSLESVTSELFLYCDPRIFTTTVDSDEKKEYINEALKIRAKRHQLILEYQEKELQPLTFLKPLTPFTWKNVGQQLIDLYDYAVNSNPPKSLALEVDLRDYFFLDHMVFLGESVPQNKLSTPPSTERSECARLSPSLPQKFTVNLSDHDVNTAFQRAKELAGSLPLVPQSLNIRDSAKESALIRRIQGELAQANTPAPEFPDVGSKITTTEALSELDKEPVMEELELESMDMSDVPLLKEEDIDMAVMSLKDIRKADFRPELLLKANVEDLSDVRSLDNVLSSVIEMEMQEMFTKSEASSKGAEATPSSVTEIGISQVADDRDVSEERFKHLEAPPCLKDEISPSAKPQDKVLTMPTQSSKTGEAPISHISEDNQITHVKISHVTTTTDNIPAQDKTITLQTHLSKDVSPKDIDSTEVRHRASPSPSHSLTLCNPETVEPSTSQYNQAVLNASTPVEKIRPPPAHVVNVHNSPVPHSFPGIKAPTLASQIFPSPAHVLNVKNPLLPVVTSGNMSTPEDQILPPPAHAANVRNPLLSHSSPGASLPTPASQTFPPTAHAAHVPNPLQPHLTSGIYVRAAHSTPSPQQTFLLRDIGPPPAAHSTQAQNIRNQQSPRVSILPPPAHSSSVTSQVPTFQMHAPLHPEIIQQSTISSTFQTPREAYVSFNSTTQVPPSTDNTLAQTPLTTLTSLVMSGISQLSTVTTTSSKLQQPLCYSSKLTISPPTEPMHSPITTSLLSPKSDGSCPRSASAYHSVLSSIEKSDTDTSIYKTPLHNQTEQKVDYSSLKNTPASSKFPQGEGKMTSVKCNITQLGQNLANLFERPSSADLILDVSRLQGKSSTDRPTQLPNVSQSLQQSRSRSPHHPSPQPLYGSTQLPLSLSSYSQQELISTSQSSSLAKTQLLHRSSLQQPLGSTQLPSSRSPNYPQELMSTSQSSGLTKINNTPSPVMLSLPQPDTLTCLTRRCQTGHEAYRESLGSLSSPVSSLLEAERIADKVGGQKQAGVKRSKPPPLSRSSSVPGYYTHTPEHHPLSYLSPPPQPIPFYLSGKTYSATQPALSLLNSMNTLYPSPVFSSSSRSDITTHPYSVPHYSNLYSGFPFSPSTTLPSYITPPRLTKGYPRHPESTRLTPGLTPRGFFDEKNEKTTREPINVKPTSPSYSTSQHYYQTSRSVPHSSPQREQPRQQQQSSNETQATTQLQNLARIAHDEKYSGDHSYHQKRGLVFQAMVESMLSATGTTITLATSQALQVSQAEMGSSVSDAGRKRAQGGNKVSGAAAKRGPKRKIDESGSDDWASIYKRRSTRSRNPRSRKDDRSIDYQRMMKKYFPQSLLRLVENSEVNKNDETSIEVDKYGEEDNDAAKNITLDLSSLKNLANDEEDCIKTYIKKCLKGHGILDMMYKYLLHLARKYDIVWLDGIVDIYINLYIRLRKHLTIPTLFCGDDDTFTSEGLRDYATIILAWAELSLSRAAAESGSRSCLTSPRPGQADQSALGEYHKEDMMFLSSLAGRDDDLGSFRGEFCVRLYWLKARQHQLFNETMDAVECFEIVSELLEDVANERNLAKNEVRIIVPNINQERVISLSEASRQLESLQRCKSLEDTQKLYDQARYDQVVDNLISTFSNKNLTSKTLVQRERPSQLLLLVNSLYNINKKSESMHWAEVSLHEAIMHYKRVPTLQLRQDWAATLVSLFVCIDRIMDGDEAVLSSLQHKCLVRLSHSLVSVIEISLDVAESVMDMPIGSLLPWKILFRILKFEETKHDVNKQKQNSSQTEEEKDSQDEEDLSPSLLMLKEAHEFLGRHSWCTKDDGVLLLFIMSVMEREMEGKNEDELDELKPIFEQCVYCLYGHPNKRGRARHLSDHNATIVTLTWERAGPVFRHFASAHPVPEFDSYRTSTVTADVENLLRRIFLLVPEKINPGQCLSVVTDYIEGTSNTTVGFPVMTVDKDLDPYNISGLLYYLLGDFYFKNKEPAKAVKFYQLDLVINSHRLDSWAGLALAKMSQIEQKLNSTELKIEKPIHKISEGALRCFQKAVELETGNCKLWLEYGSLAYQLHSHASRQIKYKDMFSLSEDVLRLAVSRCTDMLLIAKNNYLQASRCEGDGTDEDWLIFYMMGKVAEKEQDDPSIYLQYYKKAALCLHEEKAAYPRKIQFQNPPKLALEALEMFYCIQACALKLLLSGRGDQHLFVLDRYVTDALQGHFARGEEKQQKMAEEDREENLITPKPANPSTHSKSHQVYHKNPLDHEYSRHKNASDSHSEGEDSRNLDQLKTSSIGQCSDKKIGETLPTTQVITNREVGSGNGKVSTGSKSPSQKQLLDSDVDMKLDRSSVADNSTPCVGELPNSCGDTLKERSSATSFDASDVQELQGVDVEEAMETVESVEAAKVEPENIKYSGGLSERIKVQEELISEVDEVNIGGDASKMSQSESTVNVFSSQVTEVGDYGPGSQQDRQDRRQDNSQDNSQCNRQDSSQSDRQDINQGEKQDNSQDDKQYNSQTDSSENERQKNNQEDDYENNSQICSQVSSQIEESSEEDTAASCGNEADIDTDAMDVDEEDFTCTSSQTSKDSTFPFKSSQVSRPAQAGIDEIFEVHAGGEDIPETAAHLSITPSDICRHISEGFTPHSGNLDVELDNLMDISEDYKQPEQGPSEKCQDTSLTGNINDQRIKETETTNGKLLDSIDKNEKDDVKPASNEIVVLHEADETGSVKDNKIDNKEIDQVMDNEKSQNNESNFQNVFREFCNKGRDSVCEHDMDGTGDLKKGCTRTDEPKGDNNAEIKIEDEKWEMESQEKASNQPESLPQSESKTAVLQKEIITTSQSSISVPGISYNTSALSCPRQSSSNDLPVLETGAADRTLPCSQEGNRNIQKAELISKCRTGLEICASRFPTHYKSLYRLAHLYYTTKELDKAKDILLGRPDWQEQPHMPAPGLFSERKQNNFFQGLWKIPVEDIDRSGCFSSHVHRSVRLLLDLLCDLGDLEMLKHLHSQLRRTPEPGKKYLRDAERLVLAEEAFLRCVRVVQHDLEASDRWSEEQKEENLQQIYQVWLSGKGCKHIDMMTDALHKAFKIMMKGRTDVNRLTAAQAISFCQQNFTKMITPSTPTSSSTHSKLSSQNGSEKVKDGPVRCLERSELDKSSSKQNEPVQESTKQNEVTKPVTITQQIQAVNTGKEETGTTTATDKEEPGTTTATYIGTHGTTTATDKGEPGITTATDEGKPETTTATDKGEPRIQ